MVRKNGAARRAARKAAQGQAPTAYKTTRAASTAEGAESGAACNVVQQEASAPAPAVSASKPLVVADFNTVSTVEKAPTLQPTRTLAPRLQAMPIQERHAVMLASLDRAMGWRRVYTPIEKFHSSSFGTFRTPRDFFATCNKGKSLNQLWDAFTRHLLEAGFSRRGDKGTVPPRLVREAFVAYVNVTCGKYTEKEFCASLVRRMLAGVCIVRAYRSHMAYRSYTAYKRRTRARKIITCAVRSYVARKRSMKSVEANPQVEDATFQAPLNPSPLPLLPYTNDPVAAAAATKIANTVRRFLAERLCCRLKLAPVLSAVRPHLLANCSVKKLACSVAFISEIAKAGYSLDAVPTYLKNAAYRRYIALTKRTPPMQHAVPSPSPLLPVLDKPEEEVALCECKDGKATHVVATGAGDLQPPYHPNPTPSEHKQAEEPLIMITNKDDKEAAIIYKEDKMDEDNAAIKIQARVRRYVTHVQGIKAGAAHKIQAVIRRHIALKRCVEAKSQVEDAILHVSPSPSPTPLPSPPAFMNGDKMGFGWASSDEEDAQGTASFSSKDTLPTPLQQEEGEDLHAGRSSSDSVQLSPPFASAVPSKASVFNQNFEEYFDHAASDAQHEEGTAVAGQQELGQQEEGAHVADNAPLPPSEPQTGGGAVAEFGQPQMVEFAPAAAEEEPEDVKKRNNLKWAMDGPAPRIPKAKQEELIRDFPTDEYKNTVGDSEARYSMLREDEESDYKAETGHLNQVPRTMARAPRTDGQETYRTIGRKAALLKATPAMMQANIDLTAEARLVGSDLSAVNMFAMQELTSVCSVVKETTVQREANCAIHKATEHQLSMGLRSINCNLLPAPYKGLGVSADALPDTIAEQHHLKQSWAKLQAAGPVLEEALRQANGNWSLLSSPLARAKIDAKIILDSTLTSEAKKALAERVLGIIAELEGTTHWRPMACLDPVAGVIKLAKEMQELCDKQTERNAQGFKPNPEEQQRLNEMGVIKEVRTKYTEAMADLRLHLKHSVQLGLMLSRGLSLWAHEVLLLSALDVTLKQNGEELSTVPLPLVYEEVGIEDGALPRDALGSCVRRVQTRLKLAQRSFKWDNSDALSDEKLDEESAELLGHFYSALSEMLDCDPVTRLAYEAAHYDLFLERTRDMVAEWDEVDDFDFNFD